VFAHFAAPVNRLRRAHGLATIGDLPAVLSFGDAVLHPDPPTLVPTAGAPAHHHHLGPVLWSPALPRPPFWSKLDAKRPTVYVTLGSSGRAELLPKVLAAVTSLGAQALVATAGRHEIASPPAGVFVAPFLPGAEAAARADLVVSNGGSTTSYQALAAGKPVIGLPANLDQYLAMDAIVRAGAGVLVRAGTASTEGLRAALLRGLTDEALRDAAQGLRGEFLSAEPQQAFARALTGLFLKPAATSGIQEVGALRFG
jgi:UDP:flavonoid glycosyltransferase YjiC (YdhE family)